jgi:hypothetical protein
MPVLADPTPFTETDSRDAAAAQPIIPDPVEEQLTQEINALWTCHTQVNSAVTATKEELRKLRLQLGEQLHRMKELLARPGRGGQWSSFLAENMIPRTSGDRFIREYQHYVNPPQNRTTGAITDPSDDEIGRLVKAVWGRLEKKLGSRRAVYLFLTKLTVASGLASDWREGGVFVSDPTTERTEVIAVPEHAASIPVSAGELSEDDLM